jgi:hypothetical protein
VAQSLDPAVSDAMHSYYGGERREGYVFIAVGAAGLGAGTALLFAEGDRAHAFAGPLIGFGAIEFIAGIAFAARAGGQIVARDDQIRRDPAGFMRAEISRQRTISSQTAWLEAIEVVIALGGTATAYVGAALHNEIAIGLGAGLALEGAVMFMFDHFEHDRAHRFRRILDAHAPSVGVAPLADGGAITFAARF